MGQSSGLRFHRGGGGSLRRSSDFTLQEAGTSKDLQVKERADYICCVGRLTVFQ